MTQQGFEDYLFAIYGKTTGTLNSYIMAVHIIDEMFSYDDVFGLNGQSVACLEDDALLATIAQFITEQQNLFREGKDSIFCNIKDTQKSYPRGGFCSAAMNRLIDYYKQEVENRKADALIDGVKSGTSVSNKLISFFKIDKVGSDVVVKTRQRVGQNYFRDMVLANYCNKCCITGLNVPQILRASHIVEWARDRRHRMDPENGLCLSATYDAAFDKHLISFDEEYRMIVGKEIIDHYTNAAAKEYFYKFEGKKMIMPLKYLPSQKLLAKHRELMIV